MSLSFEKRDLKGIALICLLAGLIAGGVYLMMSNTVSRQQMTDAEKASQQWARFFANNVTDLEAIAEGAKPTPDSQRIMNEARKFGNVFRYKVFSPTGVLRLVSDNLEVAGAKNSSLDNHNKKAANTVKSGKPFTLVKHGPSPDRPAMYSETYLPVVRDGKTIAVVEVYVDQSDKHAVFRENFLIAALAPLLLVSLAFGGPAAAFYIRSRQKEQAEARASIEAHRLRVALDTMSQGLCMFDAEQRLIVSNERYAFLYGLTLDQVKPGTTFRQILEYRIANEMFAGQAPEEYIEERLAAVVEGVASTKIQVLDDGRVIAIVHQPLPGGGWVATHEDVSELKKAESLNLRLARIVEDSINEVYIFDAEMLRFEQVNAAACSNLGYTVEEMREMTPLDLKPDYTPEMFEELIAPLKRRERKHIRFETTHRRKDGSLYDVSVTLQCIRSQSRPVFAAIIEDITERKKADGALRESEALFSKAFHATPTAFAISNPEDGFHHDVNEAWVSMLGYSRDEALSHTALDLGIWVFPEERIRFVEKLRKVGSVRGYEVKFRTKSGDELDLVTSGECVEVDGEPRLFVVYYDITERKKAELALNKQKEELDQILSNVPHAVIASNHAGIIQTFNPAAEKMFGYSANDAIGCNVTLLMPEAQGTPQDGFIRSYKDGYIRSNMENGKGKSKTVGPRRVTGRRKDGSEFPLELALAQAGEGENMSLIGVAKDITDELEAETQLVEHRDLLQVQVNMATVELRAKAAELEEALAKEKELNELQRQFVSMASHEFRTPLAIIDLTAQRMKRQADKDRLTPASAVEKVGKIRSAVVRMTRLMESTLSAAQMEEGKIAVNIGPCDVRKAVREVCSRQQEIAARHVISYDVAGLPDTIQADSGALGQILTNLLCNAVKYAPDAPDIAVKAEMIADQVVISVRDHGLGIGEDELPSMFSRFFRARTSTGIAGTGIGLHMVKTLVEMHDGTVGVESKEGEGSIFTIRLPVAGPSISEEEQERTTTNAA